MNEALKLLSPSSAGHLVCLSHENFRSKLPIVLTASIVKVQSPEALSNNILVVLRQVVQPVRVRHKEEPVEHVLRSIPSKMMIDLTGLDSGVSRAWYAGHTGDYTQTAVESQRRLAAPFV